MYTKEMPSIPDDEKLAFDGAFPDHLPPEGVYLQDYTEASRRAFAIELLNRYVPSKVGDAKFREIAQGRAEEAKVTEKFFSTCGELVMFLWSRMGYRGLLLNRDIVLPTGVRRKYAYGKNMSFIRFRSVEEKCWVHYKPGAVPQPGDILFVSNGPPHTEHVCVFHRTLPDSEWETFDAGQYKNNKLEQESKICHRPINGRIFGSRELHGWVDLSRLELVAPAHLDVP
jgi:hypothetical protein